MYIYIWGYKEIYIFLLILIGLIFIFCKNVDKIKIDVEKIVRELVKVYCV